MNVIFAHDEKLQKINEEYYSTGSIGNSLNNKYLKYFSNMTLLLRCEVNKNKVTKNLKKISGENVGIVEIPDINTINIKENLNIRKIIKEEVKKADKVIARLPSRIGTLSIIYAKKYNKPYCIELVGCPWDALINHGSIKAKIVAPIMYLSTKFQVRRAKNVLYVTNKFLQKRYPNKNNTVACSDVEIEEVSFEKIKKKINNFDISNIKIGIIGSLTTRYKGHEEVFRAIGKLKERYNIKLHILGYGNLEPWNKLIDELGIRDNIVFDGTRESGKAVWEWLDNIDIYLQPSYTEGMPRATIEAMSRGCAIVTTNVGGFSEIVSNEFLVNRKDWSNLCSKIELLIHNNDIYDKQIKENYNAILKFKHEELSKIRKSFYNNIK